MNPPLVWSPEAKDPPAKAPSSKRGKGALGPEIITFALPSRARATRTSSVKVRTGCITCKRRHIKCDEAKPSCQRCLKWKGHCEGYDGVEPAAPKSKPRRSDSESVSESSRSPDSTPSPPAETKPSDSGAMVIRARPRFLMAPDYNSAVFSDDNEKLYFDNWLDLAPSLGGGWFKSRLWSSTIPQLSTVEPAVRYAAMAVGALTTAAFPIRTSPEARDVALRGSSPHYRNALTYFGRALRLIGTEQRQDQESRTRAAILACLLFVCFETLHDNRKAAIHHINHGLQVLEHFLSSRSAPDGVDSTAFNAVTTRSPSPYVLEDEVMQVFQRLDVQASSMGLWRPRRPGRAVATSKTPPVDPRLILPGSFADLEEARRWWDLVQRWLQEYPRQIRAQLGQESAARRFTGATVEGLDLCDLPGARELQARYLGSLEAWQGGFAALYAAAVQGKRADEAAYLQACSLRLQYLVQWIGVQTIWHSDYRMMYLLTPHFREVNRLAGVLLPRLPEGEGLFTLDNGPSTALFFTALKCRDADVREEGIRLLEEYPRKDGFWDTRTLVTLAKLNRGIEADNETEGSFKEQWWRLRQREGEFVDGKPEMEVSWMRKDSETGEFKKVKERVSW